MEREKSKKKFKKNKKQTVMGEIGGPDRKTKQKEITITETRKK